MSVRVTNLPKAGNTYTYEFISFLDHSTHQTIVFISFWFDFAPRRVIVRKSFILLVYFTFLDHVTHQSIVG